jgi:hypothetical protein
LYAFLITPMRVYHFDYQLVDELSTVLTFQRDWIQC